jgi:hypothetical protein
MVQCFSLTIKQHQPVYQLQKPSAEQLFFQISNDPHESYTDIYSFLFYLKIDKEKKKICLIIKSEKLLHFKDTSWPIAFLGKI